jgi:hypothetical protein
MKPLGCLPCLPGVPFRSMSVKHYLQRNARRRMKRIGLVLLAMTQTGCIVAGGGYGSRGGWFIWPGGLGGLLLILLLFFFLRRGR